MKTTTSPFPADACPPLRPPALRSAILCAFDTYRWPDSRLCFHSHDEANDDSIAPPCLRVSISPPFMVVQTKDQHSARPVNYNFIKLEFLMRLLGSRRRTARSALALAHARAPGHGPPLPLPRRPHLLPSTPNIARPCNAHVNLLLPPPFVPFSLPRSSGDLPSAASAIAWNPNVIASGRRTPGYRRAKLARTYIRRRPTWWLLMRKS